MGRPARNEGEGAVHHVIPQGTGGGRIVEDDHDRLAYLRRFGAITRELEWVIHAGCLMDTHHHAVLETARPDLAIGMRRLLGGHSRWLNARHGRTGAVFKPHFWSSRIDDDAWLFRACLYVVLNPVAAGLCPHPRDWPWCTYRTTAEGDPSSFAPGEKRLLGMFGRTPGEARRRYAHVVDEAVDVVLGKRCVTPRETWHALGELEAPRHVLESDSKSDTR